MNSKTKVALTGLIVAFLVDAFRKFPITKAIIGWIENILAQVKAQL
jgi:FtsH-binding integral membrane protein